jgi:Mn2+/Fe2+ NRAMP family transporter
MNFSTDPFAQGGPNVSIDRVADSGHSLTDADGLRWWPTPEDRLRARDRSRIHGARAQRRPLLIALLIAGPGILAMLGENDGPSMLSYATAGATYGIGFFVPFVALTFFMAYIVQEMTVRIAIATQRGHAELIHDRFGPVWGGFALADLAFGNVLTLITEFIAIRAGAAYFGIAPVIAVGASVLLVLLTLLTRRYARWERIVLFLALGNLVFIPTALFAHPNYAQIALSIATWQPLPGGSMGTFLTLVLATIGATVTPWMLFFQQSAVVDKGLTATDLLHGRLDTAMGAMLAAMVAIATIVGAATLFAHHVDVSKLVSGADFATALRPFLGTPAATLFAVGMIEAGIVAALTISTSSAYAVGEVLRKNHSLNTNLPGAGAFYLAAAASLMIAAAATLIPGAPLIAIAISVNVIASLLMLPALVLLLLLANDRAIMGPLSNTRRQNAVAGSITLFIGALGTLYSVVMIAGQIGRHS